jgi:transcription antitermination factor NusG
VKWYVLQVLTGKETAVRDKLHDAGFQAAVPQEDRLIRKSGKWIQKLYTLFSGYVFIQLQYCAELYYKILATPDVYGFLRSNEEPVALTYLETEYLRQLNNQGEPIQPAVIRFNENGSIQEINGVMAYFGSRILKYDRHARRARILVSIGGAEKEIELSAVTAEDEQEETGDEPEAADTG